MINKLIGLVKKQNEVNFNEKGYKITMIDVRVDDFRQTYTLTFRSNDFIESTFQCDNVTQLNKLLKDFGFENILEVK